MTQPRSHWSDEDLDRAWDELADQIDSDAGDPLFAALLASARFVVAHDDVPPPRPAFIHQLRRDLYGPREAIMQPAHLNPIPASGPDARKPALLQPPRRRAGWRAAAEFAVVAAVIAAMVIGGGAWLGFPSWGGSNRQSPANQAAATVGTPLPAPTMPAPVGMFQGDAARTNQMPGPGPVGTASIVWKVDVNTAGAPVIAGNRIYGYEFAKNATAQVIIAARDLQTGAVLWTAPIDVIGIYPTPAVANGLVYAMTTSGIVALDAATGAAVWTYEADAVINNQSPAVANGLVYATFHDETLRAVDALTGKEAWRATIPESTAHPVLQPGGLASVASPAVANGIVYTVGNGGVILASDATDGHQRWAFQTAGDVASAPLVSDGLVVFSTYWLDMKKPPIGVQAVDANTGALAWQTPDQLTSFAFAGGGGTIYLVGAAHGAGAISELDAATGQTRWTTSTSASPSNPLLANGVLYFSLGDGTFSGINIASHATVWNVRLGVSGAVLVTDGLAIISSTNAIYALDGKMSPATPGAATTPIDLSGLPPCNSPRTVPAVLPTGTPAAKLDVETNVVGPVVPGTIAQILVKNLPAGDAASPDAIAGITRTLTDITNCMPPAGESDAIAGFFTDDFFRRGAAAGGASTDTLSWPNGAYATGATVALADGRVALVQLNGAKPIYLLIFARQNGRWLIDERYLIVAAHSERKG